MMFLDFIITQKCMFYDWTNSMAQFDQTPLIIFENLKTKTIYENLLNKEGKKKD